MTQGSRLGVPRRSVIAGVVAAVLTTAGCGIRLEDDAPRVPLLPTRTPVPAEAELVRLTRGTAALADLANTVAGPLAADLAALHRRQYSVLRNALLAGGVPAAALEVTPTASSAASPTGSSAASPTGSSAASPTGSSAASPTGSSAASPTAPASPAPTPPAALAAAEAASAVAAASFAGVTPDLRPTIAALHAQRYAAADLLSGHPPKVPGAPVGGDGVGALATLTTSALYFQEVVSARSTGAQRARSDTTLAALRALLVDQEAGGARPDTALGHPLPFPVNDAASAARLARDSLTTLRAGYGEQLGPVVAADGGPGLAALTRWLGSVEVEVHRWGVGLEPFPGLE